MCDEYVRVLVCVCVCSITYRECVFSYSLIFQFLLNKNMPAPIVPRVFAELLLSFLTDKLKLLSTPGKPASMLVKLFYLVFESVCVFPENELVLQPHLASIINTILKMPTELKDCDNYFILLKVSASLSHA